MTEGQKRVSIQALAALGWSDGKFTREEKELLRSIVRAYGYGDVKRVSELLSGEPEATNFEALTSWQSVDKLTLLNSLRQLMEADGTQASQEIKILKTAASALFPKVPYKDLETYWAVQTDLGGRQTRILES